MKTININGKEFTKEEFYKVGVVFFNECSWCEEAEEVPDEIFKAINLNFPRYNRRPMSELPEKEGQYNFLVQHASNKDRFWITGHYNTSTNEVIYTVTTFKKKDNTFVSLSFGGRSNYELIGWLPLPNPNDIKP